MKRKRGVDDAVEADPKLREFLEVMKPATKNKTWANGDMQIDQTAAAEDSNQVEPVHVPEADSDDEYQTVQKKPKHSEATSVAETSDVTTPAAQPSDESLSEDQQAESDAEEPAESGPVSDADWLRSKTSRTLGVVDDDDEELAHRPKPSEKEVSDTAEDAEPESADDAQPPTSGGGAVVDKTESRVSSDIESIRQTGRLFLRNLPYDVSEDDLRGHFDAFGALEEVSFQHSFIPSMPLL